MVHGSATPKGRPLWTTYLWAALRISIALLALYALERELSRIDRSALIAGLTGFGWKPIVAALACAGASFLSLGVFELLALRDTAGYKGCEAAGRVPRGTAIMTSFIANAFSQSIGMAVLTGSAVRVRAYARYGVRAAAIARVSAFVTLTATLGLLAAGGVAFFEGPAAMRFGSFSLSMRAFGVLLSLPSIVYLAWALLGKGTLGGRKWGVHPPSRRLAFSQVVLSVIDWLLTGTVLFVLLPATAAIGYFAFLAIYLIAQTVGVVSHVPGGIGVFEASFLSLVGAAVAVPGASLLAASLVMYRVVYYLIPLVIAMAVAALVDLRQKHREAEAGSAESRISPLNAAAHAS